jgi:hypothetical protein
MSQKMKKRIRILFDILKATEEKAGAGNVIQLYGSADQYPCQNVADTRSL